MLKLGICFNIDNFCGELVNNHGKLMRRYDNGEMEYGDDIDIAVADAIEENDWSIVDQMLTEICSDSCRMYDTM